MKVSDISKKVETESTTGKESLAEAGSKANAFIVWIPANVRGSKYYETSAISYLVYMTDEIQTAEDAINWVNNNKEQVLQELDAKRRSVGNYGRTIRWVKNPAAKNVFFKDRYRVTVTTVGGKRHATANMKGNQLSTLDSDPVKESANDPIVPFCKSCDSILNKTKPVKDKNGHESCPFCRHGNIKYTELSRLVQEDTITEKREQTVWVGPDVKGTMREGKVLKKFNSIEDWDKFFFEHQDKLVQLYGFSAPKEQDPNAIGSHVKREPHAPTRSSKDAYIRDSSNGGIELVVPNTVTITAGDVGGVDTRSSQVHTRSGRMDAPTSGTFIRQDGARVAMPTKDGKVDFSVVNSGQHEPAGIA